MLNNYTVKKMLPRILIAIIAVNLSWGICLTAINITNAFGDGISSFLYGSIAGTDSGAVTFSNAGDTDTNTGFATWAMLIGGSVATGVGVAALWTGGIFAVIPIIITAAAALLIGLIVLMLRRFFIAALVLVSPLALVAWAIPGMEEWAKKWWSLFSKLLIMFPMIMLMFAVSDILSGILQETAGNFVGVLMLIVMRFAPFALMPIIFKAAGGAFSTITGMVNDRGKGIFDRGRNWSKQRAGETNNALTKKARKDTKLGLRTDRQKGVALNQLQDRTGFRGWNARRGLSQEDRDVLRTEQQKHRVRRQSAELEGWKAEQQGRQLDISSSQHDVQGNQTYIVDDDGNQIPGTAAIDPTDRDSVLMALARGQRLQVRDAAGQEVSTLDGTVGSMQEAAMQQLASMGRSGQIRLLRGDPTVNQSYLQTAVRDNVGSLVEKAPDLIKPPIAAFETSMSPGALKKFSRDTIESAGVYADTHAVARDRLLAASRELVDDQQHFGDMTADTAQALMDELTRIGTTHGITIDAHTMSQLRSKVTP